jgi:capsular polysaccharide biosynthesis protein
LNNTEPEDGAAVPKLVPGFPDDPQPVEPQVALPIRFDLKRLLVNRWRTIAGVALAVILVAAALTALQPKQYRASSVAAVVTVAGNVPLDELYRGVEVLEQPTVVSTVASLASLPSTIAQSLRSSGPSTRYTINAVVLPGTNLLRLDVDGPVPSVAAGIANQAPAVLDRQVRAMYGVYGVKSMSPAATPTAAIAPRPVRVLAVALVLGLALGTAIAFALDRLSQHTNP